MQQQQLAGKVSVLRLPFAYTSLSAPHLACNCKQDLSLTQSLMIPLMPEL